MSGTGNHSKFLTAEQVERFRDEGYVSEIEIFNSDEVATLHRGFDRLAALLENYESPYSIDGWEKWNVWLYDFVMDRRVLDCVEDLLGPNFYQWGSNMMAKAPREGLHVPWHQDSYDWPLRPHDILTVWSAFDKVDDENGCLQVIPGSHKNGLHPHIDYAPPPRNGSPSLLPFHLDPACINESSAVSLPLRAGQISIHAALLCHYSEGNRSDRRRCGFTACYAGTHVKCVSPVKTRNGDWTDFAGFLCRGTDEYGHFRHVPPPREFGRGPRKAYRELSGREERNRPSDPVS
jgi:ectoine hydroxylase-related dioxygenase (phytanoyl-CoA dioxygenase family)